MKLPNGDRAVVPIEKITDYCLNFNHPDGKNKARVFRAALGITNQHAELLRSQLLASAIWFDATFKETTVMGDLYYLDFPATGPSGQAIIRSGWIVRKNEDFPRLTTAFVLNYHP